ncbi:hypothetical protein [Synoicihabitans lomoniglobus]|uniref:Uncharacterized protein n=1 Tax=Synoicihabitans lomoniglobus TaxID=2909285 RepID=A0AAF0CSW9_9BACT|nr:hypothetical protein [Opitutaceae bacterium LMO-M01]WED67472.1 hypothetical protein PXH66_11485 [Opitutaceae bacterium LMO-M01]
MRATTIVPPDFAQLVDESHQIVRATVESVRSYPDTYEGRALIRTEVILQIHESLRGDPVASKMSLHYLGGEYDGRVMQVDAMPTFTVGKEMVLFVEGGPRKVCPLVGWSHGQFRVQRESATGEARVVRADGSPLTGPSGVSAPLRERGDAVVEPLSRTLTLDDFRQAVRDQARKGRVE